MKTFVHIHTGQIAVSKPEWELLVGELPVYVATIGSKELKKQYVAVGYDKTDEWVPFGEL